MRKAAVPTLVTIGLGAFLFGCVTAPPVGNTHVPQPSKKVDLQRYLGKWYELARYDNRFERGCEAVMAEYSLLPNGRIRVVNSCHVSSPTGRLRVSEGTAKIVRGSGNAKLKVSFFGPFYLGNYWVLDHADDYAWSVVGEPSGRYLWLLSRDPHPSEALRQSLVARAAALGYDTDRLRPTQQLPR